MTTGVKPLNGREGYLRWKESMLLRLHTAGVAHMLSDDPPASSLADEAARKRWARDDAICRGHILAALSDRLLPDYVRHATGRALWGAVARTYDLGMSGDANTKFYDLALVDGAPLLEQIAHAEALAARVKLPLTDANVAYVVHNQLLPYNVAMHVTTRSKGAEVSMDTIWDVAGIIEALRIRRDDLQFD